MTEPGRDRWVRVETYGRTDEAVRVTLSGLRLGPRTLEIDATSRGFAPWSALVARVPGYAPCVLDPIALDEREVRAGTTLALARPVSIAGAVRDVDGAPLADAIVLLVGAGPYTDILLAEEDGQVARTDRSWIGVQADAEGRFAHGGLPPGLRVCCAVLHQRRASAVSGWIETGTADATLAGRRLAGGGSSRRKSGGEAVGGRGPGRFPSPAKLAGRTGGSADAAKEADGGTRSKRAPPRANPWLTGFCVCDPSRPLLARPLLCLAVSSLPMPADHRILIADDDRDFRLGLADLIGGLPRRFEILQAETGVEALAFLRGQAFDLALLDMHMPGQTGLEILMLLRRETRAVPCIFISGDATDAVRQLALHEGACAVLKKPLRPELLRAEVRRVLRIDAA